MSMEHGLVPARKLPALFKLCFILFLFYFIYFYFIFILFLFFPLLTTQ